MKMKNTIAIILTVLLIFSLVGCTSAQDDTGVVSSENAVGEDNSDSSSSNIISSDEGSLLDITELFTTRDLEQSADLTDAVFIELESNKDVTIDNEGIYVLSGEVEDMSVVVEADDEAKVQIVLDSVNITNEDSPVIYVKSADKVFVTSTDSDNYMEVSGSYKADGDTNVDAVIFSKEDLVLNGIGTVEIVSDEGNGITSKDDLKITGGVYTIDSLEDGIEANDSIRIFDGDITIVTDKDALHSENDEDASLGYIYIQNGTLNITAADDAIRGNSIVQIDGGIINIETCSEGIEGTYLQINGGEINIYATDDGINATSKSTYDVVIEVNGGTINVRMGSGDTDGFDANGDIYINGGTITVEANSAFDSDGKAELNGGEVTINGEIITEITQMQMGGGRRGR
ncbi:MAG: carbohydrate-binding domain-containing protein [Eubacteriaceae bacterium]